MSKNSNIFINGEDFYSRAYFGWQNKYSSLTGLIMGYRNSANDLVEIALEKGQNVNISVLDTYIYPVFFMYRHSIELSIKRIYLRCCGGIPKGGHDLIVLWDKVKKEVIDNLDSIFEEVKEKKDEFVQFQIDDKNLKNIRLRLIEISKVDSKSDVFRYLIDNNGELYFTDSKFIDYKHMKKRMNDILEYLEYLYIIIDEYLSW
ncbi:MAG: hypothetical protein FH761_07420 [Firmicutes bacterium]|nr:hypothetical protein [Bacillota bacterium]